MATAKDKVLDHNAKFTASKELMKEACSLAGDAAGDMVAEYKGKAGEKYESGKQKGEELSDKAESVIKQNPLVTVGCAFAAGWLFSKLVK